MSRVGFEVREWVWREGHGGGPEARPQAKWSGKDSFYRSANWPRREAPRLPPLLLTAHPTPSQRSFNT